MKIAVAGLGPVGLANAIMLAHSNEVVAFDSNPLKVAAIQAGECPIADPDCARALSAVAATLSATNDVHDACAGAQFLIVATPTDYDAQTHAFDTSSIETVVREALACNPELTIIIRSTVPVGYTRGLRAVTGHKAIVPAPDFLRETFSLSDAMYPARIVVGDRGAMGESVGALLRDCAMRNDVPVILAAPDEAEAVKLFANTFLGMRVAFFNELDSIAMASCFDPREVIEGLARDPRVGAGHNNPSFGYSGLCLPKDGRQLLANFDNVPQDLMRAIVDSNDARKSFLADRIAETGATTVGIYRLTRSDTSENLRESAVQDLMEKLAARGVEMIIYEPVWRSEEFAGYRVERDFARFSREADLIVANRLSPELRPMAAKVFTRDLFGVN